MENHNCAIAGIMAGTEFGTRAYGMDEIAKESVFNKTTAAGIFAADPGLQDIENSKASESYTREHSAENIDINKYSRFYVQRKGHVFGENVIKTQTDASGCEFGLLPSNEVPFEKEDQYQQQTFQKIVKSTHLVPGQGEDLTSDEDLTPNETAHSPASIDSHVVDETVPEITIVSPNYKRNSLKTLFGKTTLPLKSMLQLMDEKDSSGGKMHANVCLPHSRFMRPESRNIWEYFPSYKPTGKLPDFNGDRENQTPRAYHVNTTQSENHPNTAANHESIMAVNTHMQDVAEDTPNVSHMRSSGIQEILPIREPIPNISADSRLADGEATDVLDHCDPLLPAEVPYAVKIPSLLIPQSQHKDGSHYRPILPKNHVSNPGTAPKPSVLNHQITPKKFTCQICLEQFRWPTQLTVHTRIHTGERPYKCIICSKSFIQKKHLDEHRMIHTREKQFACVFCSKTFYRKSFFNTHMKIHADDRKFMGHIAIQPTNHRIKVSYTCKICAAEYPTPSKLDDHIKTHDTVNLFSCDICLLEFTTVSLWNDHAKTHAPDQTFKCIFCEKRLSSRNLIRHVKSHTGAKPYECSLCPKAFATNSHLKYHMKTHTGEKPYACTGCSKTFATKSQLISHNRTHTGEKPFKCTLCDKEFARKGQLTVHTRLHTGEKPYNCTICREAFIQKNHLNLHMRTHI